MSSRFNLTCHRRGTLKFTAAKHHQQQLSNMENIENPKQRSALRRGIRIFLFLMEPYQVICFVIPIIVLLFTLVMCAGEVMHTAFDAQFGMVSKGFITIVLALVALFSSKIIISMLKEHINDIDWKNI